MISTVQWSSATSICDDIIIIAIVIIIICNFICIGLEIKNYHNFFLNNCVPKHLFYERCGAEKIVRLNYDLWQRPSDIVCQALTGQMASLGNN